MQQPRFKLVGELARKLQHPIQIYDLEATTFRGRPNFGITEVSCFAVAPDGSAAAYGTLINPERTIDPEVSRLTGITQAMVRDKETWGVKYAGLFARLAAGQCWVAGFNNSTFDNHAVVDMNDRYGHPIEKFTKTFDVRRLHLKLSGVKSKAGTLQEVGALYGILPKGDLHRAEADTVLTLEVLDALCEVYTVDSVGEEILAVPRKRGAPERGSLTSSALVTFAQRKRRLTLADVASEFGKEARAVSFEVGRAIDERLLEPGIFASDEQQTWLASALLELDTELLTQGKLKPLYEAVNQRSPVGEVDYVQLRIGLLQAGLSWSSLKPA